MIRPEDIVVPGFNPREADDQRHIQELEESLDKDGGQRSKVLVAYRDSKPWLIDGGHLIKAAVHKKISKLEVIVYDDATDEECLAMTLRFDLLNKPLDALTKARRYKLLMDKYHWSVGDLLKHTPFSRRSEQYIYALLSLLKLDPQIQKELEQPGTLVKEPKGELSPTHAKILTQLPEKEQLLIAKLVLTYGISVHDTQELVSQRQEEIRAGVTTTDIKTIRQALKDGKMIQHFGKVIYDCDAQKKKGTLVNVTKLSFWKLLSDIIPRLNGVQPVVPKQALVESLQQDLTRLESP